MDVSPAKRSYFTCANVWWKLLFHSTINKTDPVAIRNEELLLVIKKIFVENKGRYGVRRVYMDRKSVV